MASRHGGYDSEGDNGVGACEKRGVTVKMSEVAKMTSVSEGILITSENAIGPTDISMLNDYVMAHLFGYLSLTDLKNCRLVNRSWKRFSTQAIMKGNHVIFILKNENDEYPVDIQNISKLAQVIRSSSQFPWTKFLVSFPFPDPMNTKEKRHVSTLLRVISPFATEIDIYGFYSVPQNLEFPNLRKLHLYYSSDEATPTGSNRKSLLRMVERASNLKEIGITGEPRTFVFMELLEAINCRKITRLLISRWIEAQGLVRLSEMGFHVKFLDLAINSGDVTAASVTAFLQSQSTCLEELVLGRSANYGPDPSPPFGLECPRMEKLRVLNVKSPILFSRVSYKDMFPALRKLTIFNNTSSPVDCFFNDDIEPVETVEYLNLGFGIRHPQRILQAARQFPKLRSVLLHVSPNLLNIVGHAMPQLQEMELLVGTDDINFDAIFTGFSENEVETLKGLPSNQLDVMERSREPVHFLKNLKKLRISLVRRNLFLSDFGCRFGLLKMEHLKVLKIEGNSYPSQISDQVMERMRKQFVVLLLN